MHHQIQNLLLVLKSRSIMSYDLAQNQYQLLKQTKASKQDFLAFINDLQSAINVYN